MAKKALPKKTIPKRKEPGLPPGTLIYTGQKKVEEVTVYFIQYNATAFQETYIYKNSSLLNSIAEDTVTWINVDGLHKVDVIEEIGRKFNLHPLVMEDILNINQIPKVDDYEDEGVLFITMNEFFFAENKVSLETDQLSLILGKNFVITFQERAGDVFEPVRDRIANAKGRIRKRGSDYLAYALMDALVDSYYIILDKYNEDLSVIENEIIEAPKTNQLTKIHALSKNLIFMRKSVAPLKEVIYKFLKDDLELVNPDSKVFLRDLLDHINQILNAIDTDREFLTDLINTNTSNINSRLNEIIKVLTLISTIFIPLTFIVGVYGMNFDYLPELHWHYAYPVLWGIMICIAVTLVYIFKKNKWL